MKLRYRLLHWADREDGEYFVLETAGGFVLSEDDVIKKFKTVWEAHRWVQVHDGILELPVVRSLLAQKSYDAPGEFP